MKRNSHKIGFVGAGRVGKAFGLYLNNNDFCIEGYYSRTLASMEKAAEVVGVQYYTDLSKLVKNVDILFITTNDDNIKPIIQQIIQNNWLKSGQIVVHMSGSLTSDELGNIDKIGCGRCSLHPLQSFSQEVEKSIKQLSNTVFTIEGDKEAVKVIKGIIDFLGNTYYEINKEFKVLYHAGACIFSNYLVTLMDIGSNFFNSAGIKKEDVFPAILPLIDSTIRNMKNNGINKALTGPVMRKDINTIEKHLDEIKNKIPDYLEFYKQLCKQTFETSKGINDDQTKEELNKQTAFEVKLYSLLNKE